MNTQSGHPARQAAGGWGLGYAELKWRLAKGRPFVRRGPNFMGAGEGLDQLPKPHRHAAFLELP